MQSKYYQLLFFNMQWAFILVICIIAISVIVIAMVRTRLKNKSKELAEKLNHISAYSGNQIMSKQERDYRLLMRGRL